MKYAMLIYTEETALSQKEREECYRDSTQYAQELNSAGKYLSAVPLHPTGTATSVRVRGDKRMVTDGPYAETREQLGGFFLVEARDLDEAIDIAARIPGGRWGTVEIRPVVDVAGLPITGAITGATIGAATGASTEATVAKGAVIRGAAN
jgi:hypothetical protein